MSRLVDSGHESVLAEIVEEIRAMGECPYPAAHFAALEGRADLAEAIWDFARVLLTRGQLPRSISRVVIAAIAKRLDCHSCPSTMEQSLATLGLDPTVLDRSVEDPGDPGDPASLHRLIIAFASKAAADPLSVTDGEVDGLRAAGLVDGDLIELALIVAFTKLMNTWADVASIASAMENERGIS